jgi:hypothetical protein
MARADFPRRCEPGDFAVFTGNQNTRPDNPNLGVVVRIVRWKGTKPGVPDGKDDYWIVEGELVNAKRNSTFGRLLKLPFARDCSLTPLIGTPREIVSQLISLSVVHELK